MANDATWMESKTKSTAKEKRDAMIKFFGYPPARSSQNLISYLVLHQRIDFLR
jgi:predicted metalloendopeptidase